ncbi:MAG: hypothetical protein FWD56_02190 [Bacteroidales bacterium]|nr:hypothetical protein [Bacteroidales bacterium]
MKKTRIFWLTLWVLILVGPSLMAQQGRYGTGPDSTECKTRLSFYREYVRSGDILSAVPSWRIAMALCPRTANQLLYSDGQTIIRTLMQQPGVTPQERAGLIDSLMLMYDIRIQHYPQNAVGALINKIKELSNFRPDSQEEQLAEIERLINLTGNNTVPEMLGWYMSLIGNFYVEGKRTPDDVMDAYTRMVAILDAQEEKSPENEEIINMRAMIENYLISSGVATCENLIGLFTPRFQANPNDLELVSKIASMLTYADCTTSDLYLQAVTSLNKLAPSSQTAYYLYRVHASKNEFDLAMRYLQEAINSPDISAVDKGRWLVDQGILFFKMNNSVRAMNAARSAIDASSTVRGKAFMLMASIWAGQRCGEDDIEKRAPFWVAVDYLERAKAADPSCAAEANRLIAQYRQYFPLQEEAFMYDLAEGSNYTVSCGNFRETTTVRTRK